MSQTILNKKNLATAPLRKKALDIAEAGYSAINIERALSSYVGRRKNFLIIKGRRINLSDFRDVYVVGIGKGSLEAARVLEGKLGRRIRDGVVIDVKNGALRHIKTFIGTHPFPSEANIAATEKMIRLLSSAKKEDLVVALIFGGGSALACKPGKNLTCADFQLLTGYMFKRGANIYEINVLRKHLSLIHGGNLAYYAYPAKLISLINSDVPGDDISIISSGPTVLDTTTIYDAEELARRYNLSSMKFVETPKEKKYFQNVENILCISNIEAAEAMAKKAKSIGFRSAIFSLKVQGEARDTGKRLINLLQKNAAVIAAGETTVTVRGKGKGGRNQELVLGALEFLPKNSVIASFASDGRDNGDAAGAIADAGTIKRARELGLNPKKYLVRNDSYNFFKQTGDLIFTDQKSANVSDLMLALRGY